MIIYFSFYSLLLPLGRVWGFYHGFKTARDIYTTGDIDKDNMPMASLPQALLPQSEEERLAAISARNIENYGTDIPQREVR